MKQCISRLIAMIKHLWQTLKEYVCKRFIRKADTDNDGKDEIIIDLNGSQSVNPNDSELPMEDKENDR